MIDYEIFIRLFYLAILNFYHPGQVYQLKTPSMKYLTSLPTFDSSDPTKDWGYPKLSVDGQGIRSSLYRSNGCETPDGLPISEDTTASLDQLGVSEMVAVSCSNM